MFKVGVCGWNYPNWRGDFYPAGLRQSAELSYVAQRLDSVEINGSFYSLQSAHTYSSWRLVTPPGFVFAVKGGRYITHLKRLRDPLPGLANFLASGPLALGDRLGPFLWQLPESLSFDKSLIGDFLQALPRNSRDAATLAAQSQQVPEPFTEQTSHIPLRHALEVRSTSYYDQAFLDLLADNDVALVCADTAGRFPYFDDVTADFVYVRLHGPSTMYAGSYRPDLINWWARRTSEWISQGIDVYVYFDNDADGAAPWDAMALAEQLVAKAD